MLSAIPYNDNDVFLHTGRQSVRLALSQCVSSAVHILDCMWLLWLSLDDEIALLMMLLIPTAADTASALS